MGATNDLNALNPINREAYPLSYPKGITITVTGVGGSRTVSYAP